MKEENSGKKISYLPAPLSLPASETLKNMFDIYKTNSIQTK